ncbi:MULTISPECIES: methyltransferase domain-containing protein [Flavobacterium]|uniref:Class I SAM-dependent methyltransferase n=2 Tax=Flavobacterium TaxID=237 RepID=A0A940X5D6_9FLAO|nr:MULTISPECIES: methyltransferase domain-containing protein [Flavobacterium]MBP4137823.1 class I SAM-dependent methyltransferase [Flavobacterium geliluteum]MDX6182227.1 methyltransferase domain-containing protein [Flavobacterium sp. Fl-33]MDX6185860.1 methyltransferase domain-containing protein [Flavobacterium sp. Fl-77]UFH39039.1 class I SAM-dependent methyltransferase [Flavobacterium sp. F-70]
MLQKIEDLEKWNDIEDPWGYNDNVHDALRKRILLDEIPKMQYKNVLDIGCGQGFVTKDLPGEKVYGVDISETAIKYAQNNNKNVIYSTGSIFEIDKLFDIKFDLIIITGVLYPQYIGNSSSLIYLLIDKILKSNGILISVHINEWYSCQFPYLKINQVFYDYREFTHNLEIYSK